MKSIWDRVSGRLGPKVAIVTGAGDAEDEDVGVGSAIATVLAAAGARVLVFDRDSVAAGRTVDRITGHGGTATAFVGDVTSTVDCDAAVTEAVTSFGQLDILINNAATLGEATTLTFEDADLLRTVDINLMGPIRMARACVNEFTAGSSIVNISSLGALRSFGRIDYEASKGALLSLTNTLAIQLGPRGIRVNAVTPGQVWTPLGKRRLVGMGQGADDLARSRRDRMQSCPLQIEGTGWDIGLAVLFMVSEDARWITGHSLVVDGGQSGLVGSMPH